MTLPQGGDTASKTTVPRHDGTRSTERSRWWRHERSKAEAWETAFRKQRQQLLKEGRLTSHSAVYCEHLEEVIHRIKFGGEQWIKRTWLRLKQQYRTADTSEIASAMRKVMTDSDSSGLYQLISFDTDRKYTGLCNQRPMCERFVEHLTAIKAPVQTEAKYKGMKQQGGASSWYMVPIAVAAGVVPEAELKRLETVMIRSEPRSWNNYGQFHRSDTSISNAKAKGRSRPNPKKVPEPVHLGAKVISLSAAGDMVERSEYSLTDLLTNDRMVVHSSKLRQLPTTDRLRFRHSVVRVTPVIGTNLNSFTGSFKATLKYTDRLNNSWFYLRFIQRSTRQPARSESYKATVASLNKTRLAKNLKLLQVDALYSVWWISRRENSERQHETVKAAVKKELKGRGIMALPESRLVLRVPPEARISKIEIRRAVKSMLTRSHLPAALVSATMWSIAIVYEKPRTIGTALDTTKQWIPKLVQGVKCRCSEYPSEWPRRHDHICLPSWDYTGPFGSTARALAGDTIPLSYNPDRLVQAIVKWWLRYFPAELQTVVVVPSAGVKRPETEATSTQQVQLLSKYLDKLVVMGIDKCRQRKLIVCPVLFEQMYRKAFQCDPDHFIKLTHSEGTYEDYLKEMYTEQHWNRFGGFHSGSPPVPYPLAKLKDLIVSCATVHQSKGTCCRQRPISPNTDHWLRAVYKRIGSVLRRVISHMPDNSMNLMCAPKLTSIVQSWQAAGDTSTEWLTTVGDVSNCYDELEFHKVLQGVQWALASLPGWVNKQSNTRPIRVANRFAVNKYDRKDCTIGPNYNKEERITVSSDDVLTVCRFDIHNSVMFVRGFLWQRIRGAPMGGFLSAFYAILCFAYIEHRLVMPMFCKLGLPGGLKRYLDDVLLVVGVRSDADRLAVKEFTDWLGTVPYPPPLKLNLEAFGEQEFLEVAVTGGSRVSMVMLMKRLADWQAGKKPYRARFSQNASRRVNIGLAAGIIIRAIQYTTPRTKLELTLLQLQAELKVDKVADGVYKSAIIRVVEGKMCSDKKEMRKILINTKAEW